MRPSGLVPLFASALCCLVGLGTVGIQPAKGASQDPTPRVVVLITVDGARPEICDRPDRTPFLTRLAREGRSLEFATTPVPVTFPATVSVMTGLYPDRSGVRDDYASPLGAAPATIAEAFQKAGWKTAAFPSDCLSHARSGIDRGFERFLVASPSLDPNARADSAVAFLDRYPDAHAFVWIGFSLLVAQQPWERFRGSAVLDSTEYLDRAGKMDQAIGRLLTAMAPHKDILVVLAGTHGESVPGWMPAGTPAGENPPAGHGLDLSEAVLRVPLVFSWSAIQSPRAAAGDQRPEWISTIDVFPTVASLAGIPVPDSLDGVSLRAILDGGPPPVRPIFHELELARTLGWGTRVGVREGSFKFLSYDGSTALLRIDSRADGTTNRGGTLPEEATLRQAIQERFKVPMRPLPDGKLQDPQFGLEDDQIRSLDKVRQGSMASQAAESLHRLTGQFPNNGPLLLERAMLDVYGRREQAAATLLDSLRKARPDYIEAEAAYCELLLRFDRTGVAQPRLASLSGWPMFEVDRLWRLGAVQVMAKQYDDAARTYRLAEAIGYPSDERLVRLRDERFEIRRLEAEVTSYPDKTTSMVKIGQIFGDLDLYDDCYAWLHRARGKAPVDPDPEYWLGHYLMQEGRAKHASVAFTRALEKDSTRVDVRVELSYAQLAQGEDDQALVNLRKAAASGKTDALADYNLACLLAREGEVEESFRSLADAVRKGYSNRQLLETDPDLDRLRKDPRFARLIGEIR